MSAYAHDPQKIHPGQPCDVRHGYCHTSPWWLGCTQCRQPSAQRSAEGAHINEGDQQ